MSSGSRRHRGSKRCKRTSDKNVSISSSECSSSHRSSNRSSSRESSILSSNKSLASVFSVGAECNVMAPDMKINEGDRKQVYELADKGKLVVIHRTDGTTVYMLRCVDGRRVYIEKGKEGASLMLTNPRGKIIKALAGQY